MTTSSRTSRPSRDAVPGPAVVRGPKTSGVPPVPPEDSPTAGESDEGRLRRRSGERAGMNMDVKRVITDRIVAMLAQGEQVCRARWVQAAVRGTPRNAATGQSYRGVNALLLWDAAIVQGYKVPQWLTYRQAKALGAQVRKSERGVLCAQFRRVSGGGGDGAADTGPQDGFLRWRPFWLFNVAQVDGLAAKRFDPLAAGAAGPSAGGHGAMEKALRLVGGCHAAIRHGFDRAAYVPTSDEIHLPLPTRFASCENYAATLLHELVHWSGHPQRLHRAFGARYGDAAGAFEALVAELGVVLLMGHCGLVGAVVEGHSDRLAGWLELLRHDRSAIFAAMRLAGEAFDFIVARQMPVLASLA